MRSWFRVACRTGLLGVLLVLAACQTPQVLPPSVPVNGIGYVVFNTAIAPRSRDLLLGEINRLVGAGAKDIHIAFNSPGGQIEAAQGIVEAMARWHAEQGITFEAYNIGMVASATSYVFLNAQKRYANPRSAFLFHAAGLVSTGMVPAQRLREEADKLDAYERVVRATMKAHTKLTDAEATTYVRRTVLLNPDDARRDGVIDAIMAFAIPAGARAAVIASGSPGQQPRPVAPAIPN